MTSDSRNTNHRSLIESALLELKRLRSELAAVEQAKTEPIAIIGMACRFPGGANDPESYWQLLRSGSPAITEVPSDRAAFSDYFERNPEARAKPHMRLGGFIKDVDKFDPEFFGISRPEAVELDPQQRMILEVGWEALENAAQSADSIKGSAAGVFMGLFMNDYSQLSFYSGQLDSINAYNCLSNLRSMSAGRLSYCLDLRGPAMQVDTACSSSLLAAHLACQSLRLDECDLALAGGVNLILSPEPTIGASRLNALAPDGQCKTFSASANGYVRGEGCGVIVLKRLSDALASGDNIYALIRGSAVNHDGHSNGLTAPNGIAQEAVIRAALKNARANPAQIQYVEAHGTGTLLGDPMEVLALDATLCQERSKSDPLIVGSVKTVIGHLESAAGVASLMKAALSLGKREIPPHLHIDEPNPHIPWDELPIRVPAQVMPWPVTRERRMAAVSSFGMSGTNVHMILEEPPAAEPVSVSASDPAVEPQRPLHILTLSAKDETALRALAGRYERYLKANMNVSLADLCFTASAGRAHLARRLAVIAESHEELAQELAKAAVKQINPKAMAGHQLANKVPRIAFLFTGDGPQYRGVGRSLYESQPVFRQFIRRCDHHLKPYLDVSLLSLLYPESEDEKNSSNHDTGDQVSLFALEYALAQMWMSWGIQPSFCIGQATGEIAAACVAGVFNLDEALRLVIARSRLQTEKLAVAGASRRPPAQNAIAQYAQVARQIQYRQPSVIIISNAAVGMASAEMASADYWIDQAQQPQPLNEEFRAANLADGDIVLEIGPASALGGLDFATSADAVQALLPGLQKQKADWLQVVENVRQLYLSGAQIDWAGFDRGYQRKRLRLPTYPFQRASYWVKGSAQSSRRDPADFEPEHADQQDPALWLYEVQWQEKPLEYRPTIAASGNSEHWLIFSDRKGFGQRFADRLKEHGDSCVLVFSGTRYEKTSNRDYIVNPSDPAHFIKLIEAASRNPSAAFDYVAHMWNLDLSADEPISAGSLIEDSEVGSGSVLHLTQALAKLALNRETKLRLITRGAQPVGGGNAAADVRQAALLGLGKVLALEFPQLQSVSVDLDPSQGLEQADELVAELKNRAQEDQTAFRNGKRFIARLTRMDAGNPAPLAPIHHDATYLITGGLGALGLEVAKWLVKQGARHLALAGRSAGTSLSERTIEELKRDGANVLPVKADISDRSEASEMFELIARSMPPLKGIFHAAGVLDDGILLQQDWDRFKKVFAPKIAGGWNLHELSANIPLDLFVCFSSAASMLGSPGQGSYAAANAFLDALAFYRRSRGQAGLSINWGHWANVGMGANMSARSKNRLASVGIESLPIEKAVCALGMVVSRNVAQAGVLRIRWPDYLRQFAIGAVPGFLRNFALQPEASSKQPPLLKLMQETSPNRRRSVLTAHVRAEIANTLGTIPADQISPRQSLFDLGMDSLMAIELSNSLETSLGLALSPNLLFDHPTIEELTNYLSENVRNALEAGSAR